ncbi:gcn5 family acetyltransferase [Plakobranchus ocellatus]|uniref:Gcn5 family acetyltransferase n=1 Tax=Plakobranchus ocellatus TaxID=259542 RepID=A0AAV3ZHS5_9GAST|nr:gcn5 family acetyltransferase [Plakobranchus ocellatus]
MELSLNTRPFIDWSQFSQNVKPEPDPVIIVRHVDMEDAYGIFRRLSHEVARCRYDVPLDHKVIVAYKTVQSDKREKEKEAIGIVTFWISQMSISRNVGTFQFMDSYFHHISFMFVNKKYQRQGIGTKLLDAAMATIRESGLNRPIHLEAAKSAVQFFRKKGFVSLGRAEKGSSHRGSSLFSHYFNMQHKFS